MKAQAIFDKACTYLSQLGKESDDLKQFAPFWLDTLVAEALPYENARRRYEGRPELPTAPEVQTLDADIPYHDDICRIALPYGLASVMYADDDNQYSAQDFRARFISALADTQKLRTESVVDVYA